LEVHNAEGAATNKQRLEVLEEQEELIEDESKQEENAKETTGSTTKVKDDVDLDEKEEARRLLQLRLRHVRLLRQRDELPPFHPDQRHL
jgi:predicted KAP-like P-loop ATPase